MSSRRVKIVAGIVLSAVLVTSGAVIIAQGNRPRTEAVTGIFTGAPVNAKQRVCEGADGAYLEVRGHFSGAITSSDPRLTGTLDFMAEPALVNLTSGLGTFRGRFRISDPATGKQTAQGEFYTVVTEGFLNHGFALGTLMNAGSGAADSFFARFESTFDASLNVSGQFGGAGDARTPAVVQGGHCSGPFMPVP
jgi:hypothetical protein